MTKQLCIVLACALLSSCATSSEPQAPVSKEEAAANARELLSRKPGQMFGSWHFMGIEPGVTTRDEVIAKFGEPNQSMSIGAKALLDTWIERSQVVSAVFEDGRFSRLQAVANVNIRPEDKRKLGL